MEEPLRPNPDTLLKRLREEDDGKKMGKLKIFFGYAAGVGKTYAMLEAAHAAKNAGIDVVAGYIEPHTRPDTMALLEGLEQLPTLNIPYKTVTLHEFDLDGAIRRRPALILVDELAHTNAEGCRNRKRYQDIEELLRAGIDVYTTVNVQHIESINDIVASITGVIVRERIPDRIFDNANQVELVDIEPDDLMERLNKGKVYRSAQAEKALSHFFVRDNLVALREIALRRTADRVNKIAVRQRERQNRDYYTEEHILVCLSASPSNAKVIRNAARLADAFHGSLTALLVETPHTSALKGKNLECLRTNLKLAEQLGAKIATVYGEDVPRQIAGYAKESGVSKIVMGRSNHKRRWPFQKSAYVERLTALAPNIDVYIIPDNQKSYVPDRRPRLKKPAVTPADTAKAVGIFAGVTLIGYFFDRLGFSEANVITVYILGVLLTAYTTNGKLYGMLSTVASVLIFNFLFIEPRFSFSAYEAGYPVTFLFMFIASFITSTLTLWVKEHARQSARTAYRMEILLDISQRLQTLKDADEIYREMGRQLLKLLGREIKIYPVKERTLDTPIIFREPNAPQLPPELLDNEPAVAQWVFQNNKHAGATTNTLPGSKFLYLAVRSNNHVYSVAAIRMESELDAFDRSLTLAILDECALALEKEEINQSKREIEMHAEQERLRANLLRAISHDLRTPLTSISGNAGILLSNPEVLSEEKKKKLYTDIYDDAIWLINLIENLLSVTRIENGTISLNMHPELLQEIIDEALRHISRKKSEHHILVSLSDDLLMVQADPRLLVQVFINLIDNAIKYTPVGSTITVSAQKRGTMVQVQIADDGDGLSKESMSKLFDMFYTADNKCGDSRRSLGLGLPLCKSIITAHGGTIEVSANQPHGLIFTFTLQAEEVRIDG